MNEIGDLKRRIGLSFVLFGVVAFVVFGYLLAWNSPNGSCDFEPIYYHARFVIQHEDPYVEAQSNYLHLEPGGYLNPNTIAPASELSIPCVYPPTALFVVAPLAALKWREANLIWMTLLAGSIVIAALMVWSVAAEYAPVLAGLLIAFTLVNSVTLLLQANAAGLAVGLAVIALMLFLRQKFEIVGVFCLAISLCLKPHDGVFIWLFMLVADAALRRRAFQTLLVFILLLVPSLLWVSSVSPNWRQEMAANIALISSPGGVNDPGPTSSTNLITNSAINLQTVFAVFTNKPSFYNPAAYVVCSLLFLWLFIALLRKGGSLQGRWLAIAAISALAMLPVYHRHHDARMLLLAVPACAILLVQNRSLGWVATFITFVALAATGDVPRAILQNVEQGHAFTATTLLAKTQMVIFTRPAPLALLVMAVFFLWLCARPVFQTSHGIGVSGSQKESVQLS